MRRFKIGDVVRFDYRRGTEIHDENPKVLILHTNWECHSSDFQKRCMHGLNLGYLPPLEQNFIRAVVNPEYAKVMRARNRIIDLWLKKVEGLKSLNIFSPLEFYLRFVRGFIQPRGWNPYRRYRLDKIDGGRIVMERSRYVGKNTTSLLAKYAKTMEHARGKRI